MLSNHQALAIVLFIALVASTAAVSAAPLFYLSDLSLGTAQPGLFSVNNLVSGTTGQLNIYAMTDIRLSGVSLDLVETGGGIEFTGLNVVDEDRWWILDGPQVIEHSRISSIGGGALPGLSGNGIGPGDFLDANYHPSSGYLLATVDYRVVDAGRATNFELQVGQNAVADWDGNIPMVHFGDPSQPAVAGTPPPRPALPDPPKPDPPTPDPLPTQSVPIFPEPIEQPPPPEEGEIRFPIDPREQIPDPFFQRLPSGSEVNYVTFIDQWSLAVDEDGWAPRFFPHPDVGLEDAPLVFVGVSGSGATDGIPALLYDEVTNFDEFREQLASKYEVVGSYQGLGVFAPHPGSDSTVVAFTSSFASLQEDLWIQNNSSIRLALGDYGADLVSGTSTGIAAESTITGAAAPEPASSLLIALGLASMGLPAPRTRTRTHR
jgi:hypothetical protein